MKIFLIEDEIKFANEIQNELNECKFLSYNSVYDFNQDQKQGKKEQFIKECDVFFLDFYLGNGEDIFDSGIYQKIIELKKPQAKIAFISSLTEKDIRNNANKYSFAQTMENCNFLNKDSFSIVEFVQMNYEYQEHQSMLVGQMKISITIKSMPKLEKYDDNEEHFFYIDNPQSETVYKIVMTPYYFEKLFPKIQKLNDKSKDLECTLTGSYIGYYDRSEPEIYLKSVLIKENKKAIQARTREMTL